VLSNPTWRNVAESGTAKASKGTRKLMTMKAKTNALPGTLKVDNAKAAMAETNNPKITVITEINNEFANARAKGPVNRVTKCCVVHSTGTNVLTDSELA